MQQRFDALEAQLYQLLEENEKIKNKSYWKSDDAVIKDEHDSVMRRLNEIETNDNKQS